VGDKSSGATPELARGTRALPFLLRSSGLTKTINQWQSAAARRASAQIKIFQSPLPASPWQLDLVLVWSSAFRRFPSRGNAELRTKWATTRNPCKTGPCLPLSAFRLPPSVFRNWWHEKNFKKSAL